MKTFLSLVIAVATFACQAQQTFIQLRITPTQTNAVLQVPTNTLALLSGGIGNNSGRCFATYEGYDRIFIGAGNSQTTSPLPEKILGPCQLELELSPVIGTTNFFCQVLVEFKSVNSTTPEALIQPAGFAATMKLETSTDLSNWQTLTNASFPKSGENRFFRTSLTLP